MLHKYKNDYYIETETDGFHSNFFSLDLRIRRQHSSESVSSINSATSHSSIGSGNDADSKKKKKKNWVSAQQV